MEKSLAAGVLCAVAAFIVQATIAGRALGRLRRRAIDAAAAQSAIVIANRIAALLLAIAVISMAAARYV
jgi:hypothetical protein